MIFRLLGLVVTFGIISYLLVSVFSSNKKVDQVINTSPAMQEQQKVLQDMGINSKDKDALKNYTLQQAKQIEEYQNQPSPSE